MVRGGTAVRPGTWHSGHSCSFLTLVNTSINGQTTTAVGGMKGADGLACGRSSVRQALLGLLSVRGPNILLTGRETGRGFRGLRHYVPSGSVSVDGN